ncbi:MAG: M20/M25/M40 family metallo-hydrolase [Acidobacteriota bacterium]
MRRLFDAAGTVLSCGLLAAAASAAAQAPEAPPSKQSSSSSSSLPSPSLSSSPSTDFIRVSSVEPLPPPVAAALAAVRAPALSAHVAFLASPALEGRGLGARGLDAAAEYAAAYLALAGIPPLAEGTYFQSVPLREITGGTGALEIESRRGETADRRTFVAGTDCLIPQVPARTFTGSVVFAGYGIRETSPARDDYRGLDVKGKIVVVLGGAPDGAAWKAPALVERWAAPKLDERYVAKLELARSQGAIAVLAVEGDDWATKILPKNKPDEKTYWRLEDDGLDDDGVLLAPVSPAVGAALLGASGPGVPRALPGVTVTLRTSGKERAFVSRNVVGALAGSDPKLAGEAVVLGAHLDHLGIVDGAIQPGADDNASGVAALLEIARAFASSRERPKRTLVFAFWTGEEEGKFGSAQWVRHPLWPLAKTPAYLNLDMIGHPWTPDEMKKLLADSGLKDGGAFLDGLKPLDFGEPGVADFAPDLVPILARAARGTGVSLHLDRTPGIHGGSDYKAFARAKVPFLRFFGNFFKGYHEPGDTPAGVDLKEIEKTARLALASAWLLADR